MPRGKYARRRQARIDRETGSVATAKPHRRKIVDPHITLGEIPHARTDHKRGVNVVSVEANASFEAAVTEAQKLKRAKRRGCSNIDRNMETLGYRRVFGDEMVPEQFELIS